MFFWFFLFFVVYTCFLLLMFTLSLCWYCFSLLFTLVCVVSVYYLINLMVCTAVVYCYCVLLFSTSIVSFWCSNYFFSAFFIPSGNWLTLFYSLSIYTLVLRICKGGKSGKITLPRGTETTLGKITSPATLRMLFSQTNLGSPW